MNDLGGRTSERLVLVTGANGFVGRATVRELLRTGRPVTAAVRLPAAFPDGVRTVPVGNVDATTDWGSALAGADAVIHLAARVHVTSDRSEDPLAAYREVNVEGTLSLARQAIAACVRRFIFVSSVKVNGESTSATRPFLESDAAAPLDPYGVSKHEAEEALHALATDGSMEVVIVRPPLVYGVGVGANFRSMARWLRRGVPLPLGAIRENRRSLLALDNLIDLLLLCLDHPAAANETFFGADGEDISTADLVRRTAAAMGMRARLITVPPRVLGAVGALLGRADVVQRLCGSLCVDTTKARTRLGWRPPVGVDEGLRRAVGDPAGTTR